MPSFQWHPGPSVPLHSARRPVTPSSQAQGLPWDSHATHPGVSCSPAPGGGLRQGHTLKSSLCPPSGPVSSLQPVSAESPASFPRAPPDRSHLQGPHPIYPEGWALAGPGTQHPDLNLDPARHQPFFSPAQSSPRWAAAAFSSNTGLKGNPPPARLQSAHSHQGDSALRR